MANLVAIAYPNKDRAWDVLKTLGQLQTQYLIDIADAAIVIKDDRAS